MTLATGKPSNRGRLAFTLIELILVMTLLVVVVSMIAPKLSGFIRGRALDSEARRLQSLARAGQSRAVAEGMPMMLWLDTAQGQYGLSAETAPANGDPKDRQLNVADNLQLALVNTGAKVLTTFHNRPAVRFQPDGTMDENSPGTIQIVDSGGVTLWLVALKNRTGYEIRDTLH
jgi:Tfp pilus assembly protein FimT